MIKHKKKISIPKLRKKAFTLWSLKVRSGGVCELCGKKIGDINKSGSPIVLDAHHLIERSNHYLAWDVENGCCLCKYCHKFSKNGPHKGGLIFAEWFRNKFPEKYKYLLDNHTKSVEITRDHLEEIIKKLETN